eukprot:COSAG01_NODE_2825_length_7004_cov_6.813034_1_plen_145_part_00
MASSSGQPVSLGPATTASHDRWQSIAGAAPLAPHQPQASAHTALGYADAGLHSMPLAAAEQLAELRGALQEVEALRITMGEISAKHEGAAASAEQETGQLRGQVPYLPTHPAIQPANASTSACAASMCLRAYNCGVLSGCIADA